MKVEVDIEAEVVAEAVVAEAVVAEAVVAEAAETNGVAVVTGGVVVDGVPAMELTKPDTEAAEPPAVSELAG